ncbi:ATP-binding protein [Streptacidiphilus cavernicola]
MPLARHILLGTMASAGVDPDISHEVGVALTEACANAVEHARHSAATGEDSGFQVTATIENGCLRVEITDNGPGFSTDPARTPPVPARTGPCTARARRRRPAPLPVRSLPVVPLAVCDPFDDCDLFGDDHLPFEDLFPFDGIPADAGTELPDLDATSGRGLFLIRALMDHVQFRNHPRSGAVVSFDKVLKYRDRPLQHAS